MSKPPLSGVGGQGAGCRVQGAGCRVQGVGVYPAMFLRPTTLKAWNVMLSGGMPTRHTVPPVLPML